MQKSRTEYSILNIMTGLGGYMVNTVLGIVCRIIFTRCLNADYLGISGLFGNILSMLSLAELGIGSAIVYALYKPLATGDKEKIASLVKFYGTAYKIIGIVVAAIGIVLMPFLDVIITSPPDIKENLYIIYAIYIFNTASTYFFSYRTSLLMAAQQNYIVTGLNYIITILQSVIQMAVLLLTKEYYTYLIIQSIGTFVYNFTISHIAVKKYPFIKGKNIARLPKKERRGLIGNIRALTIWKISSLLVNSTDNIIITYFSGLISVGLTSNYTLLSGTLNTLIQQLFSGVSASVGNHNALEDDDSKFEMFSFLNLMNFWLFGWGALGILFCSTGIVSLLFGEKYALSTPVVFTIALNFFMVGIQSAVWTYKNTLGIFRQGRYMLFATAALNLIFSIWLGKICGLFGIFIATAIARACTNQWYDPYAVFKYGLKKEPSLYFKKLAQYVIIITLCGVICFAIGNLLRFNLIIDTIFRILLCSVVFNGIFLGLYRKTKEFAKFKEIFKRVINKLFSRIKSN